MQKTLALFGALVLLGVLASCLSVEDDQSAAPAPDVNVTNVMPAQGDSGLSVMLAFAGIFALLFAVAAVVGWMLWANQRRQSNSYAKVIYSVTGVPAEHLMLTPGGDLRVPQPRVSYQVSAPVPYGELPRGDDHR